MTILRAVCERNETRRGRRLVEELGGKFHWGVRLARIGDAAGAVPGRRAHVVVNASGLGAGALCGAHPRAGLV